MPIQKKSARDFAIQRLFCISHTLVKKWNSRFLIEFLKSKPKIYILSKNVLMGICGPHLGK